MSSIRFAISESCNLMYSSLNILTQVGTIKRTAQTTREDIANQIKTAMTGKSTHVEKLSTATGTKDKIAQPWIDKLILKSREPKAANPSRKTKIS